ncbi:unnamed protein product [Aureobasidium pullulans]|nr:unnamed protein product [Aureobasidium pullulans]
MAAPTTAPTPKLTPAFCFNQTALRDFLRISRSAHIGFRPNEYFTKPAPPHRPPHNTGTGM